MYCGETVSLNVALKEQGLKNTEIARQLGVSEAAVRRGSHRRGGERRVSTERLTSVLAERQIF